AAAGLNSINVTRHGRAGATCTTIDVYVPRVDLSHPPYPWRYQPSDNRKQTCVTHTADSLAAQGFNRVAPYTTILKMLNVVTGSALLHWHRAQEGVFIAVPP
ncbi:hypothetical protein, partial [Listeria seeligeri]|uniref:hypothetical protein n=1 Tax=Listeria seeligeri TaxID=1640 RepID=UPI0022EC12E1